MGADDDDDELLPTPIRATGSYPVFRTAAAELARDLEKMGHIPGSIVLRARALDFLDTFERWTPSRRPTDEERAQTLRDFLEFNRTCLDFIQAHRR